MASGLYRVNPTTDPIVSQIHSMLPNRSQKSSVGSAGASSARPSSAGATRRPGGATFGYNKVGGGNSGNTSNANIYNAINSSGVSSGLFAQGYSSSQRPSSAGHSRPSANPPPQQYSNINQININGPPVNNTMPSQGAMGSSSGRPKSAGAIRRNEAQASQQQQQQQQQQQPLYYMPQPTLNPTYNIYSNPFGQTAQRPLSANATAYTTTPHGGLANQWDAYKQYTQVPTTSMQTPQSTGAQPVGYGKIPLSQDQTQPQQSKPRPQSASSAASKLRKAVDLSRSDGGGAAGGGEHSEAAAAAALQPAAVVDKASNLMKQTGHLPIAELAGLDNDLEDGLDGLVLGVEGVDAALHNSGHPNKAGGAISAGAAAAAADDEEMDGKPIDSRSHPEVSMTTPSASLELHNGSSTAVDVRNTSLDSFSEENINIGLTTIPNQFCSKRDALELRKLLVLSAGTRGGIVPSSSAVMDMYMVGKVVGVGSYGKVRAAWHRLTGAKVAIKTYDKAKLKDPAHWKRVHSEIKIMEQISHPRIARLYEAVETPKRMHLIMECLDGGNLCSYVKAKRRLSEDESKRIFFQILTAIEYLHSLGVSHRDIKLENVLFVNEREIKLIDFGFSTVCQPGKKLKVFCGTPSYMAPEIVRRAEYEGKPVDMWSLGILLYALLCGCFPFRAKAYPDLYRRIARGAFAMPEELSAPVKDLLRQLLTVEIDLRMNAHAAMRHAWLQPCLLNAPNMDKMRQETTILISEKPADDLDEQVLSELVTFGMSRDETIRLVLTKTHSSLSTLYYLLLDCLVTRRRASGHGKQRGGHIGPSMSSALHVAATGAAGLPVGAGSTGTGGGATMRPLSANYAAALAAAATGGQSAGVGGGGGVNGVIKPIPTPMARVTGTAPGTTLVGTVPTTAQQYESMIQQQVAEQLAAQQQQQMLERQEYRYRPKSASQNRAMTPSSAAAMAGNHLASSNAINLMNMASGQAAAMQQHHHQQQQQQQQMHAVPTLQQQTQQRPLSAFAGRR